MLNKQMVKDKVIFVPSQLVRGEFLQRFRNGIGRSIKSLKQSIFDPLG